MNQQKPSLVRSLRACARAALEQRGFVVRKKVGAGIVPGARLRIQREGQKSRTVSVRISKKRRMGIARHPWTGKWFEIPGVDEVVVVSPSLDDPELADVIGFDSEVLVEAFNALDTLRNGPHTKKRKANSPIFIALDPSDGSDSASSNLIAKASWLVTVPVVEALTSNREGFIERVRREFAELNGVDASKVIVNFQIVG